MLKKIALPGLLLAVLTFAPAIEAKPLTDAQIKQKLIKSSIAEYPGNCPCPYNTASNGSSCGRRSAYSRDGGYAPLCYPNDVTPQMVKEYRQSHKGQ